MVIVACGTVGLAACGSSGSSDSQLASLEEPAVTDASDDADEVSDSTTPIDPDVAFAEYESCMKSFGVEVGVVLDDGAGAEVEDVTLDDEAPPAPFDAESFEAAEEECGPILEDAFGDFELNPEQQAQADDQMLEFERCLDEKGFGGVVVFDVDDLDESQEADESTIDDVDPEALNEAMNECDAVFGDLDGAEGELDAADDEER